jgi:predicted outer membrane protein
MLVRTSFMMAMAMLATPIWAQQAAPTGRQDLAEQQQLLEGQADRAQPQQGQAPQGQARQNPQGKQRGQVQQGQPQVRRNGQPQGQAQRASGEIDVAQVAQMFILGNQAEVELGNLAIEKSQNENVREFAQTMVKDHTAFIAKLNKFTGHQNQVDRTGEVRTGEVRSTTGARPQAGSGHDAMADLHRKSAELGLSMTKQMLSQYEGQDFDMGYLGQQCVAHTQMLACLTAAKGLGPQDFQATIEGGITTAREHLLHAKQIATTIKNKEYGEGQRRESARPDLRDEGQRRDGVIRDGQREPVRDVGARPAVRPQNSDAPREGAPLQGTPRVNQNGDRSQTDGAPESARDREGATP